MSSARPKSGHFAKSFLALAAIGASLLGFNTSSATAVTSCVVANNTNSNGTVQFEIHYSDNTAGCSWTVPAGVTNAEVTVVGGGGSGGWGNQAGGGGGGQVHYNSNLALTPGAAIPITIGTGGAAPATINRPGGSGTATSFGTVTADGGGGGGGAGPFWKTANMSAIGLAGGSSGGNNIFGTTTAMASYYGSAYGSVSTSTFAGWTTYGHHGGAGISNSVTYGTQVSYGAGAGGGGAYENGIDSTAVSNGSGGMLTTLGRSGAGIYLMGKCLAGGGEGAYRTANAPNTNAGSNYVTANPCKRPDGTVVDGTSSGAYHASASAMYPIADSGGGGAAGTLGGATNDGQAGATGVVVIKYIIQTPTISSATLTNVAKPTISGTGPDGYTAVLTVGGATYQSTISSAAWSVNLNTATPTSGTLALNTNGTNAVQVLVQDASGNQSSSVSQTLTIDTTAPATPTVPTTPTLTNLNSRSLTFTVDSGTTASCAIDTGSYTTCASPYATGVLADGVHSFKVKTTDPAGNVSAIGTYTWTIDTTPPANPVISNTATYVISTSLTVNYTTTGAQSVTCKLDSAVATACTSSTTMVYTGLTQGAHTVTITAADTATNTSTSTYSFTVDTVAPSIPTISNSETYAKTTNRSLSFTVETGTTASCAIDTGSYTTCNSPYSTGTLTDGSHSFKVKSTDPAGNVSAIATYSWTQDTVVPASPVISNSSSLLASTSSVSISFTFEAGTSAWCKLDTGTFASCTSPYATGTLSEGAHSFTVYAVDLATNISANSVYNFTVDVTAPVAPTIADSASFSTLTSRSLAFTAEAGAVNKCSLDGGAFTTCSSPFATGTLTEGAHTFTVKSIDAAGNTSATGSYSWTQDSLAPASPALGSYPAYQTVTSFDVSFTGEAGGAFTCKLDAGSWNSCVSPRTLNALSQGAHTFSVRQTDAAGNVSNTSSYSFTVDSIIPTVPVISTTGDQINVSSRSIVFTVEAGATAHCSLDGSAFATCSSPFATGSLTDGSHTFRVKSFDVAGNVSATTPYTWYQDTEAPLVPVFASSPAYQTTANPTISFSGEAGLGFLCRVDSGSLTSCASPLHLQNLAEGAHSILVLQADLAGNTSPTASYSWTQDSISPAAPTLANPESVWTSNSRSLAFTTEANTITKCSLDDAAFSTCVSPFQASNLAEGNHSFVVKAFDAAGNVSNNATYFWLQDSIAPIAPTITSSLTLINASSRTIEFTEEPGSYATCSVDSGTEVICASPFNTGDLTDGDHTITIRSHDNAGNTSTNANFGWIIDTVAPTVPAFTTTNSIYRVRTVTINFSVVEDARPTCSIDYQTTMSCSSSGVSMTIRNLTDGTHSLTVFATDQAGNFSSNTFEFTVDTVAPNAPTKAIENPGPAARTSISSATFNFSVENGSSPECQLTTNQPNAFTWTACQSGLILTNLAAGVYHLQVRTTDPAGNVSAITSYDWEVVLGPGVPTIAFSNNLVTLSGAAGGANGDRYEFKLVDSNNSIVSPWSTSTPSFAIHQSNGTYLLFARLVDDNGVIGDSVSQSITITGQPAPASGSTPRLNIASIGGYSHDSELPVTIDWPVGTAKVRLFSTQNNVNGGSVTNLTSDWQASGDRKTLNWNFTPAGVPTVTATHTLTAEFLDAAGTVINSQTATVIIDVQAPTLTSAIPTSFNAGTLPVQILASDEAGGSGISGVVVTRSTIAAAAVTNTELAIVDGYITVQNVTLGETMTIKVKDRVGNISATSFQIAALNRQTLNPIATLKGTAKVGQTLTVTPGTWPKTHTVTYVWTADGSPIAGATKKTFKLTNAQVGKVIAAKVTGTRATYYPITVSTANTVAVAGGIFTAATPKISGAFKVGQTLTAIAGTWSDSPTLTYVWKRGAVIVGSTSSYTLNALDLGKKITLSVTGAKPGFTTVTKTATSLAIKP